MLGDPVFFAIAIPAMVFAGISKGGFGSGADFAAVLILALVIDPGVALAVMLPLLMVVDAALLRPYWRRWSWPDARILILGGVPGVLVAMLVWRVVPTDVLRMIIGLIALGFVAWQLFGAGKLARSAERAFPAWVGWIAGCFAGFTSFVSHAGGPVVGVYLLSRGLGKTTYQSTIVLCFGVINLLKAVAYTALGLFTSETLQVDLALAPFALLGAWIGVKAHRLVPEQLFFAITYVLLTGAGTKLIWDALS
ncbi:MAG: sulfite exporter TauE/SafE family protein [Pseudomonadota bacterium]